MNFLCPACKTPLPVATPVVVACSQCGVEVDLTRVDTAPGQARLWPEVDLCGEKLGDFALKSRVGSGGMGTVYMAEGLAGRAAVKVLSPQLAADPALRERFRREAAALERVTHPGVVRILAEGQQNGFCWYAMEHVDGKDLRARIAEGPLPVPEVEALGRQLLDALGAVHDAQLVHRDIKPGNILLSTTGARLCDFGIARFDGATTLTESAALLGSLRYMAPEQRAGVTTPKSDLYSLGLVLHEAATGALPLERDMPGGRLGRLIEALLQVNPGKRPADAHAAARLIPERKPRRPSTIVAVASAVLGVGAFSAWALLATKVEPPTTATRPTVELDAGAPGVAVKETVVDAGPPLPRIPSVVAEEAIAQGVPVGVLEKLVAINEEEISRCYDTALAANPDVAGRIEARVLPITVATEGRFSPLLRPLVLRAGGGKKSKAPLPFVPEDEGTDEKKAAPKPVPPAETKEPPTKISPKKPLPPPQQQLDIGLSASTVKDRGLEECVIAAVRRWKFPRFTGPKAYARLAWTFSPTGGSAPATNTIDVVRGKPLPVKRPVKE